jgi:hypothetical protein
MGLKWAAAEVPGAFRADEKIQEDGSPFGAYRVTNLIINMPPSEWHSSAQPFEKH